MDTITITKENIGIKKAEEEMEKFKMKAMILDEILEFVEDKYFGYSMQVTEKEPNIPLAKAKKLMRA